MQKRRNGPERGGGCWENAAKTAAIAACDKHRPCSTLRFELFRTSLEHHGGMATAATSAQVLYADALQGFAQQAALPQWAQLPPQAPVRTDEGCPGHLVHSLQIGQSRTDCGCCLNQQVARWCPCSCKICHCANRSASSTQHGPVPIGRSTCGLTGGGRASSTPCQWCTAGRAGALTLCRFSTTNTSRSDATALR